VHRQQRSRHTGIQFNSILFYSDVRSRKYLISAHSRPVVYFSLLVKSCTGNDSLPTHFTPPQYLEMVSISSSWGVDIDSPLASCLAVPEGSAVNAASSVDADKISIL
jgi:hypothetical protein